MVDIGFKNGGVMANMIGYILEVLVAIALGYVAVSFVMYFVRKIDYKRQIEGRKPVRKYSGKDNFDKSEGLNNELEIERAVYETAARSQPRFFK